MIERDLLVAAIAIVLGAMMLNTAINNEGWCFQMAFARKVAKHRGHGSARFVIASVGTFVILLGIYTLCSPFLSGVFSRETSSVNGSKAEFQDASNVSLISR